MLRAVLLLILLTQLACSSIPTRGFKAVAPVTTADTLGAQKLDQAVLPDVYAGRQLLVGSGGGVTGQTTTYYLLDNGRLYRKRSRETSYRLIGIQKAATTKRVFNTAENQCKIKTTTFDEPGNVSRFVGWQQGKQTYRVTWAAGDSTVPPNYPKFYNAFMAMIPTSVRSN